MIRGIYTSAIGMMTQMNKMDTITNNIANIDTNAFKQDEAIIQSFSDKFMKILNDGESLVKRNNRIGKVSLGNFVTEVSTNFAKGHIKETSGKFDFAISGDGFFAVQFNKDGQTSEKYTRDGAFTLNAKNELVTKDGYNVLSESGNPITVPNGNFSIDETGKVFSNGALVDKLKLVDFEDYKTIRKYGHNLYDKTNETTEKPFNSSIISGHIETSNVNAVEEMVKMINVSRIYEVNSNMIQTHDSALGKAVNEIARKQ